MKILNPEVEAVLKTRQCLCLNLGSGSRKVPGFFNVDHLPLPGVDILADLNEPLDALPDGCVAAVHSRHTLEHIDNFLPLMAELHRVCRFDAELEIIVPHFSNPYGYSDPTHVRFFGLYSFFYFCEEKDQPQRKVPNFYTSFRFRVKSVRLNLLKETWLDKVARTILQPLANRNIAWQDWYERRLCRWMPVSDIHYVLQPNKVSAQKAA